MRLANRASLTVKPEKHQGSKLSASTSPLTLSCLTACVLCGIRDYLRSHTAHDSFLLCTQTNIERYGINLAPRGLPWQELSLKPNREERRRRHRGDPQTRASAQTSLLCWRTSAFVHILCSFLPLSAEQWTSNFCNHQTKSTTKMSSSTTHEAASLESLVTGKLLFRIIHTNTLHLHLPQPPKCQTTTPSTQATATTQPAAPPRWAPAPQEKPTTSAPKGLSQVAAAPTHAHSATAPTTHSTHPGSRAPQPRRSAHTP